MSKKKILLIEDTIELGELINEILQLEGFDTCYVTSGEAGLNQLATFKPDLVITDVIMPGINGLEVVSAIRKNQTSSQLPIIIISASASLEDHKAGYDAGANICLSKPCSDEVLIDTINSLI